MLEYIMIYALWPSQKLSELLRGTGKNESSSVCTAHVWLVLQEQLQALLEIHAVLVREVRAFGERGEGPCETSFLYSFFGKVNRGLSTHWERWIYDVEENHYCRCKNENRFLTEVWGREWGARLCMIHFTLWPTGIGYGLCNTMQLLYLLHSREMGNDYSILIICTMTGDPLGKRC